MTKEDTDLIGEAIDFYNLNHFKGKETKKRLVKLKKELIISDTVKYLPTDECVEQWWAGGQDKKPSFWKEAPYRTNGDVVEEIKTALKYFITIWQ